MMGALFLLTCAPSITTAAKQACECVLFVGLAGFGLAKHAYPERTKACIKSACQPCARRGCVQNAHRSCQPVRVWINNHPSLVRGVYAGGSFGTFSIAVESEGGWVNCLDHLGWPKVADLCGESLKALPECASDKTVEAVGTGLFCGCGALLKVKLVIGAVEACFCQPCDPEGEREGEGYTREVPLMNAPTSGSAQAPNQHVMP